MCIYTRPTPECVRKNITLRVWSTCVNDPRAYTNSAVIPRLCHSETEDAICNLGHPDYDVIFVCFVRARISWSIPVAASETQNQNNDKALLGFS